MNYDLSWWSPELSFWQEFLKFAIEGHGRNADGCNGGSAWGAVFFRIATTAVVIMMPRSNAIEIATRARPALGFPAITGASLYMDDYNRTSSHRELGEIFHNCARAFAASDKARFSALIYDSEGATR